MQVSEMSLSSDERAMIDELAKRSFDNSEVGYKALSANELKDLVADIIRHRKVYLRNVIDKGGRFQEREFGTFRQSKIKARRLLVFKKGSNGKAHEYQDIPETLVCRFDAMNTWEVGEQ